MDSFAEYDDDVYYADLERQILTLMVDDEDDSNMSSPATASASPLFHRQMASNVGSPTCLVWSSPPAIIEDWSRPHIDINSNLIFDRLTRGNYQSERTVPDPPGLVSLSPRRTRRRRKAREAREYIPTEISDTEMAQGRTSKKLF